MNESQHRARHVELHKELLELITDYVMQTDEYPCDISMDDFVRWSLNQISNPTEKV
jgi:hypothetical protein